MKQYVVIVCLALAFLGCKEEPQETASSALADNSDPWGAAKIEQLTQDLQTGKCRIRLSPERMIPEQENLPDDTPPCLPDGLEIGDILTSPFAAFALAMSTLSAEERYIGACRDGAWKPSERVDRIFRTDEKESCNRVGGAWFDFRQPIGVCINGAWNSEERVDRLFHTDEGESCNRVGGVWYDFRQPEVAQSQSMEAG